MDLLLLFSQCGLCLAVVLSEPTVVFKFVAISMLGVVIVVFWNTVIPMHSPNPDKAQKQTIYL